MSYLEHFEFKGPLPTQSISLPFLVDAKFQPREVGQVVSEACKEGFLLSDQRYDHSVDFETLSKVFNASTLIGLGDGSSARIEQFARNHKCSDYINVALFQRLQSHVVGTQWIADVEKHDDFRSWRVHADMLTFLSFIKDPLPKTSFSISGIDSWVIPTIDYTETFHRILTNRCEPGQLVFGCNSAVLVLLDQNLSDWERIPSEMDCVASSRYGAGIFRRK